MTEKTAAPERAADDPRRELTQIERMVANVVLHDRRSDAVFERTQDPRHPDYRATVDEIDWCVRQATVGTSEGPRDVAAKLTLAAFYMRPDHAGGGTEQVYAFPLVASALVDVLLDAWVAERLREKAE